MELPDDGGKSRLEAQNTALGGLTPLLASYTAIGGPIKRSAATLFVSWMVVLTLRTAAVVESANPHSTAVVTLRVVTRT